MLNHDLITDEEKTEISRQMGILASKQTQILSEMMADALERNDWPVFSILHMITYRIVTFLYILAKENGYREVDDMEMDLINQEVNRILDSSEMNDLGQQMEDVPTKVLGPENAVILAAEAAAKPGGGTEQALAQALGEMAQMSQAGAMLQYNEWQQGDQD